MNHVALKEGRLKVGMTQVQAAHRLGVSQPYLSQLERGERPVPDALAKTAADVYHSPTALPLPESTDAPTNADHPDRLAKELAGLGYPGYAHLRARRANPAAVLRDALAQHALEVRLAEALPWVVLKFSDLDWSWLLREVKLRDVQNRLGFVVAMAKSLVSSPQTRSVHEKLSAVEQQLEQARLAREDTLGRESMPEAERSWLTETRSPLARHWNLVTGLTADQLPYAA